MFVRMLDFFRLNMRHLLRRSNGATMMEYALLLALIAVLCLLAVQYMGTQVFHVFDLVNTRLSRTGVTPGTPVTAPASAGS